MRLNTTWLIFLTTMMLLTIGIVMVYSSSAAIAARETMSQELDRSRNVDPTDAMQFSAHSSRYLKRQTVWAFISVIALLIAYQIDYEKYRRYAPYLLLISFVALLAVFLPGIGLERKGAHRWIGYGPLQVQSSELAKLALIVFMAKKLYDCQTRQEVRSFRAAFFPALVVLGAFLLVIVLEPDLGAALVIGCVVFVMWYVGGMRGVHLLSLGVAALPCIILAIIAEPYRVKRIAAFLNPESDIRGRGWHLWQSLITVGSGGLWGRGLGCGPQKYLFLSEAHTDFIFAVICEELGLIGGMCIVALYAFFIIQGIRVALRAPDLYGSLLATGITAMVGIQAYINMAVVTGLVPTKGLTLPLISYGGSSLLVNMIGIGILMNISQYTEIVAKPSRRPAESYVG